MTLDELLLTVQAINKQLKQQFKMQASIQGVDTSNWDDDEDLDDQDDSDLPQELLAAERALKLKRDEELQNDNEFSELSDADGFGFGYKRL